MFICIYTFVAGVCERKNKSNYFQYFSIALECKLLKINKSIVRKGHTHTGREETKEKDDDDDALDLNKTNPELHKKSDMKTVSSHQ